MDELAEYLESTEERARKADILPGISADDVAICCLARVPWAEHRNLRSVCRSWKRVVDDSSLAASRAVHGVMEDWIFVIEWGLDKSMQRRIFLWALDTTNEKWLKVAKLPAMEGVSQSSHVVAIRHKLYFLGGSIPADEFERFVPVPEVWEYDILEATAVKKASMRTPRDRFASAVIDGKLYVAGGLGSGWNYVQGCLKSAEVFDPEANTWQYLPEMPAAPGKLTTLECQGAEVGSKFYVRGLWPQGTADVFDPSTGTWSVVEGGFPSDIGSPFYTRLESGGGHLLVLETAAVQAGRCKMKLRVFSSQQNCWRSIAQVPVNAFAGISVACVRGKVFLIGGSTPSHWWAPALCGQSRLDGFQGEPRTHVYSLSGDDKWRMISSKDETFVPRLLGSTAVVVRL